MTSRNARNRRAFAKALRSYQSGSTDAMERFVTTPKRFSEATVERQKRKAELDALIAEHQADMARDNSKRGPRARFRGQPAGAGSVSLDEPMGDDDDRARIDTLSMERSDALSYADVVGEEAVQRVLLTSVEDDVRDFLVGHPDLHASSIHGLLDGRVLVSLEGTHSYVRVFHPRPRKS